ncbi:MAG: hypothetical protein IPM29_06875 [Planctomycetes bacterium]|nr:hypothetical protein [Planctomycetota bacterium]
MSAPVHAALAVLVIVVAECLVVALLAGSGRRRRALGVALFVNLLVESLIVVGDDFGASGRIAGFWLWCVGEMVAYAWLGGLPLLRALFVSLLANLVGWLAMTFSVGVF